MQDKKTDFVVDGQFDDIVYELKKEINKGYQEDESKVFDALGDTKLQICASIAAELIIRIEENEKDKDIKKLWQNNSEINIKKAIKKIIGR